MRGEERIAGGGVGGGRVRGDVYGRGREGRKKGSVSEFTYSAKSLPVQDPISSVWTFISKVISKVILEVILKAGAEWWWRGVW